jgi:hypothetical protein
MIYCSDNGRIKQSGQAAGENGVLPRAARFDGDPKGTRGVVHYVGARPWAGFGPQKLLWGPMNILYLP